jgi:hypothetical protein
MGSGPIAATAGEGPDLALVDDDQGAIAVMLDLVNPVFSRGWVRQECRNFRPDEAERGICSDTIASVPTRAKIVLLDTVPDVEKRPPGRRLALDLGYSLGGAPCDIRCMGWKISGTR